MEKNSIYKLKKSWCENCDYFKINHIHRLSGVQSVFTSLLKDLLLFPTIIFSINLQSMYCANKRGKIITKQTKMIK